MKNFDKDGGGLMFTMNWFMVILFIVYFVISLMFSIKYIIYRKRIVSLNELVKKISSNNTITSGIVIAIEVITKSPKKSRKYLLDEFLPELIKDTKKVHTPKDEVYEIIKNKFCKEYDIEYNTDENGQIKLTKDSKEVDINMFLCFIRGFERSIESCKNGEIKL